MSDIYGLSEYGAEQGLGTTNVLPGGTNKYIALLTTLPTARDGTGLVEVTGSGYARIAHQTWTNVTSGTDTIRKNSGAVTFAVLTGNVSGVVGWAIYSAITAGTLIAFGPIRDADEVIISRNFIEGDVMEFATLKIEVAIGVG